MLANHPDLHGKVNERPGEFLLSPARALLKELQQFMKVNGFNDLDEMRRLAIQA